MRCIQPKEYCIYYSRDRMNAVEHQSTYGEAQRKYYQAHKAEILQKCRASGLYERKYKTAYERNKDTMKAKALARYYAKKAQAQIQASEPPAEPPAL